MTKRIPDVVQLEVLGIPAGREKGIFRLSDVLVYLRSPRILVIFGIKLNGKLTDSTGRIPKPAYSCESRDQRRSDPPNAKPVKELVLHVKSFYTCAASPATSVQISVFERSEQG